MTGPVQLQVLTKQVFASKQKPFHANSPSRAALEEHAKRDASQAGIIWAQATVQEPDTDNSAN